MSFNFKSSLIVVVLAAGFVLAGPYWLTNPVDQQWTNTANWDSGALPNSGSYASINNTQATGKFPIISTGMAAVSSYVLVGHLSDGYLTQTGGTLTADGVVPGYYNPGMTGEISFTGGTATITYLWVAGEHSVDGLPTIGIVDINGTAAVSVTNRVILDDEADLPNHHAGGVFGTLNMYGGTLTTAELRINNVNCTPMVNITGGVIYWTGGDHTGTVTSFVSSGWMKGYGKSEGVMYAYDANTGHNWTKIWAIPNPPKPITIKKLVYSQMTLNLNFDAYTAGTNLPYSTQGTNDSYGEWYGTDPCMIVITASATSPSLPNCGSFTHNVSHSEWLTLVFPNTIHATDELVNISFAYKRMTSTTIVAFEFGYHDLGPWLAAYPEGFLLGNSTATAWYPEIMYTDPVNSWQRLLLQIDNSTNLANLFLIDITSGSTTLLAANQLVYEPTGITQFEMSVNGNVGDQALIDDVQIAVGKKYYLSDFDHSGTVDINDLSSFSKVWLKSTAP
jgi:hypothetical protein